MYQTASPWHFCSSSHFTSLDRPQDTVGWKRLFHSSFRQSNMTPNCLSSTNTNLLFCRWKTLQVVSGTKAVCRVWVKEGHSKELKDTRKIRPHDQWVTLILVFGNTCNLWKEVRKIESLPGEDKTIISDKCHVGHYELMLEKNIPFGWRLHFSLLYIVCWTETRVSRYSSCERIKRRRTGWGRRRFDGNEDGQRKGFSFYRTVRQEVPLESWLLRRTWDH